jgi:hypothetical protein
MEMIDYYFENQTAAIITIEGQFGEEELAAYFLFMQEARSYFSLPDFKLFEHVITVLKDFNQEELKPYFRYVDNVQPLINSKNWHEIKKHAEKTLNVPTDYDFVNQSDEEKVRYYLKYFPINKRPTLFRHVAEIALNGNKLNKKVVDKLYQFGNSMALSKPQTSYILTRVSSHTDDLIKELSLMTTKGKVLAYLCTVQAFLQSGLEITGSEKKAIMDLRASYNLNFSDWNFWDEYLRILEGDKEVIDVDDCQEEMPRLFAAFSCVASEAVVDNVVTGEKVFDYEVKEEIQELIEMFGLKEKDVEHVGKFKGQHFTEIVSELSDRAIVFLLIKSLYIVWADERIKKSEAEFISLIVDTIRERDFVLQESGSFYLLFLQFLFENVDFVEDKPEQATKINKFFREIITFRTPIKTIVFFIESFFNGRGVNHQEPELRKILNCLDVDEFEMDEIVRECLDETSEANEKKTMLHLVMKVEYLLRNKPSKELNAEINELFKKIHKPNISEKNLIGYFILKSLLLDENLTDDERAFFEDIAFQLKVDQEVMQRYTIFLFLETAVRYDFEGWLDYEKFRDEHKPNK